MIYVDSCAQVNTGGPEALIQLALALTPHRNVSLFPVDIHPRFTVEYPAIRNLPQAAPNAQLTNDDIVILPEIRRCRAFGGARVFIWLLAATRAPKNKCTYIAHNSRISELFGGLPIIRPYITPSTVRFCRRARQSNSNRSLILIDNDSPAELSKLGTVIRGYSRSHLMNMLVRARYIIDWVFVGSERMPIEGLLCGAHVLTSRDPRNSALGADFAFPNRSFVDTYEDLRRRIRDDGPSPPKMTRSIVAFEKLSAESVWDEARVALGLE